MKGLALVLVLVGCSDSGGDATVDAGGDGSMPGDDAPDAALAGSAGCGMANAIATNQYVQRTIMVGGTPRSYVVRVPAGYDPQRRYPVVYQQHGCSGATDRESNNVPVHAQAAGNAIIVRGRAAGMCWDTAAAGVDVAFWDAMVAEVEATWCIDTTKRYLTGYSSGAFMTHRLGCIRADKIRAIATIAGGQAESGSCTGTVAAAVIHDVNDGTVNVSASVAARDSLLARNGCGMTTTPTNHSPCVEYGGCAAGKPVVWCQTSGRNHDRQDAFAGPVFWDFFEGLP